MKRQDTSKKYRTSILFPGCPCCGSVKNHKELQIAQRRAKAKEETRKIIESYGPLV